MLDTALLETGKTPNARMRKLPGPEYTCEQPRTRVVRGSLRYALMAIMADRCSLRQHPIVQKQVSRRAAGAC